METTHKKQIGIIGGGIAGLTFSLCLPYDAFTCSVFEKSDTLSEVGAAISIFPNALCVMDELGLLREVLEVSGQMNTAFLKDSRGNILSKSSIHSDYPVVCIHRKDLHQILRKHTTAELHAGHEVTSVSNLPDGKVAVKFVHGETKTFDAVIGADGIHSVTRQQIVGDGKPIFSGYNIWRGVVSTDYQIGYGSETYGRGQRVGIVPIKKGVYGWWATLNEDFMKDDQPEGSRRKLARLFGDWHHPIPEFIEHTETILKNSLGDRKIVKGWSQGNITLLGDAAHPTTPNLGQGGCIAIEGAYILAKSICKYGIGKEAFDRYEALQYPRAKLIVNESLKLGKMGQLDNPILTTIRNFLFKITPSSIVVRMISRYFSYRVTQLKI